MHSYKVVSLLASAVVAQNTATVLNFFQLDTSLTVVGSDATATTFQHSCPSDAAGISAVPSDLRPTPHDASASPAPTPAPRMRRQADSSSDDYSFCEPYTIKQGVETYEFHLTDPTPGAWTIDMACSWKGEMTKADLTCDVTQNGYAVSSDASAATTSVIPQTEIQNMEAYQVVTLVSASGASSPASASASPTPKPTASGASGSAPSKTDSKASPTPSTGMAPAGPLATGAMKFVGGAAGVFAVAMAF